MKHWIEHIWSTAWVTYEALRKQWGWFCKSDSYFALFKNFDETLNKFKKTIQVLHTTINAYHECTCELFKKNCHITQCFRCQKFDHMIRFCKKNQRCVKCADKHHIEKCMISLNRRRCANCNENHEFWKRICFKWWQQMKQALKIYKNRLFRYSEALKYNHTFLQFLNSLLSLSSADSMNSSSSMNSLKFMNSFSSANSSSSATVVLKTRGLVAHELTWQMIKVKKKCVDHFSCMSSDSDKTSLEQSQKQQIRRWDKLSMTKSIQRVFSLQSQQQL